MNHQISLLKLKTPLPIDNPKFISHRINTIVIIDLAPYLSTNFPQIKALGIAVIIPVNIKY